MPRVKCLVSLAGVDFAYARGAEAEFDGDEAARLVAGGYAEYVGPPPRKPASAEPQQEQPASATPPKPPRKTRAKKT